MHEIKIEKTLVPLGFDLQISVRFVYTYTQYKNLQLSQLLSTGRL
jgi:hypothetical protein